MSTYYSRGKYKYERNAACRVVNYLSHVENRWLYKSIDKLTSPRNKLTKLTLINKKCMITYFAPRLLMMKVVTQKGTRSGLKERTINIL